MKIILCIFLLNITAVSVFGQSVELHGILGQNVNFTAAVKKGGSLMYGNVTIGDVASSSFMTSRNGNYRDRVQWDSSTGLFSLSGLREEDSGEYKVENKDQNIISVFQLNVHEDNVPVSKPHVNVTRNEYRCTILCTVDRGTGATLSWYRDGEKESYSSSSVESAPHLYLPLSVERSGTYTCEAKNSVSNEKASITVGAHCTDNPIMWILIIAVVVLLLLLAIVAYCLRRRICRNRSKHPTKDGDAVQPVPQSGETRLELSPDARRKLIQVDKLLNDSLPAYDKKFLNEDLPAYDEEEQ